MGNPFETIDSRLSTIESLLLDIKHQRVETSPPNRDKEDEFLNVRGTCEFLGVAEPTLYAYSASRKLTSYKRGKKLYFKKSELIQWIQSGRRSNVTELREKAKKFKVS